MIVDIAVGSQRVARGSVLPAGPRGLPGPSVYELAVAAGFVGDEEAWLATLAGPPGPSAYDLAVTAGFVGDEEAWLASLAEAATAAAIAARDVAVAAAEDVSEAAEVASTGAGTATEKAALASEAAEAALQARDLAVAATALIRPWEPRTATFTATANHRYAVDTTAGPLVATLPALPTLGDTVQIFDVKATFGGFPCRVDGGGSPITVVAGDDRLTIAPADRLLLDAAGVLATFIWWGGAEGWIVTFNVGPRGGEGRPGGQGDPGEPFALPRRVANVQSDAYAAGLLDLRSMVHVVGGTVGVAFEMPDATAVPNGAVLGILKSDADVGAVAISRAGAFLGRLTHAYDLVVFIADGTAWRPLVARIRPRQIVLSGKVATISGFQTIDPLARLVDLDFRTAAGGAGSGRVGAAGSARFGGGGGAPGNRVRFRDLDARAEFSTPVAYIVPGPQPGGGPVNTPDTNGNAGANAPSSTFGRFSARGGTGGSGGTTAAGSGGNANAGAAGNEGTNSSGAASSVTAKPPTPAVGAAGAGAAGGGISTGNVSQEGGNAGPGSGKAASRPTAGLGGIPSGAAATPGSDIADTELQDGGSGGGGGAPGEPGADGGWPSGAGGGSGAALNGSAGSKQAGHGAGGLTIVTERF